MRLPRFGAADRLARMWRPGRHTLFEPIVMMAWLGPVGCFSHGTVQGQCDIGQRAASSAIPGQFPALLDNGLVTV